MLELFVSIDWAVSDELAIIYFCVADISQIESRTLLARVVFLEKSIKER